MKWMKVFLALALCVTVVPLVHAQRETGSIRGTVVEKEGAPLPGVSLTVTSPAKQGPGSSLSATDGGYRLLALPPGTYKLEAKLQGFKTVVRDGIIVHVGMNIEIPVTMEPSSINQEVTVTAASPVVDVINTKMANTITLSQIQNLPVSRSIWALAKLAPGIVAPALSSSSGLIAHGSASGENVFKVDGVSMNDPSYNTPGTNVTFDIMEEIEMVTGALPAEIGTTSGVFVNVVTKSGGNKFSGEGIFKYTDKNLLEIIYPDTALKAMGMSRPVAPIFDWDTDANLGGPIFKDRLWFFTSFNLLKSRTYSGFIPTVINGKTYDSYERPARTWKGFAKLTAQIAEPLKFQAMFHYTDQYSPYGSGGRTTIESTTTSGWKNYVGTALLQWVINPNTILSVRGGFYHNHFLGDKQAGTESPDIWAVYDEYTGYRWGTAQMAQYGDRDALRSSADLSHFKDDFLGGNHEFKAGMELESWREIYSYWGNSSYPWHYYNGSPYYYRAQNNGQTDPVQGDGWITLIVQPFQKDGGKDGVHGGTQSNLLKFGLYLQDSWTIKNRLTLNIGLRFDYYNTWDPALTFAPNPQTIVDIGNTLYKNNPSVGFNPFDTKVFQEWNPVIQWKTLSPRIGFTYDLFGDGKTAVKASYSKLASPLSTTQFGSLHPFFDHYFDVNWWDLNNNQKLDSPPIDRYEAFGNSPNEMLQYKELQSPKMASPYFNEVMASIKHELAANWSVGAAYVYKNAYNLFGAGLFDIPSQRWWNTYDHAPEWWVPFTTIVPAVGNYPNQQVTMYFLSNNAPGQQTTRTDNLPQAKHSYSGVELSFDKRMSNGWALSGSVTLSKTSGNTETSTQGPIYSTNFLNPNSQVNTLGPTANDRPIYVKLFGTFMLPWKFLASISYVYSSGAPYQRSVRVYPPAAWAAANNVNRSYTYVVNVEPRGAQRDIPQSQLDARLEKQFNLGSFGKIGVYLDVFNVLGLTHVLYSMNPSGSWRPTDANTNVGTFTATGTYGKISQIYGTRRLDLSLRFTF